MRVRDLMRTEFVSVAPGESLLEADRIMRLARIRHLPVIGDEELVGILSSRDILQAARSRLIAEPALRLEHLRGVSIEEVMTREPVVATPEVEVSHVALLMLRHKIGCLPVVQSRELPLRAVGLVSETDLVRAAYVPDFHGASD